MQVVKLAVPESAGFAGGSVAHQAHMDSNKSGLARDVARGDELILSTGISGTAVEDYPAGYDGDVQIDVGGTITTDSASTVVIGHAR